MSVVFMGSVPDEEQFNSPEERSRCLAQKDEGKELPEVSEANSKFQAIRNFVCSEHFKMFALKITFVLLCIPLTIATVFFSIFDTKCNIYEQSSVINCTQSFFVPYPMRWISSWLVMSIVSPCLFIAIIYLDKMAFNFQEVDFKKVYEKGSFASLMLLLVASLLYYLIRLIPSKPDANSTFIAALLIIWNPVKALVVCFINYLPRVRWQNTNTPGQKCVPFNFIVYWSALLVYFFELICKNAAIMLDVAQDIETFLHNNFSITHSQYSGLMVIIIGFNLAFHARLLTFYWEKIFYGNKDLFAEPGDDLIEEKDLCKPQENGKQHFEEIELIERT